MSSQQAAHKDVASLAVTLAAAVYEECAKDNVWYSRNRDQKAFIRAEAPHQVANAKSLMVDMLARHDVSEDDKAQIFEALCMDAALPKGGTSVSS